MVAAGVPDTGVADAVGLVGGLLEDLGPGGAQRLEGFIQVVYLNEDGQFTLGNQVAHGVPVDGGDVVVDSGEQQLVGVAGGGDGQPAHFRA